MRKYISIFFSLFFLNSYSFAAEKKTAAAVSATAATETALFAGGCFWCMVGPFQKLNGVIKVESGYTGGHTLNPTYEDVSKKETGHRESVQVIFDPKKITYDELMNVYWKNIDPVDSAGQFCDKGNQYKSAIYYTTDEQKKIAETSKEKLAKSGVLQKPIVTEIIAAQKFYAAEEYHQDYYKKNPIRYKYYRNGCGRDKRLEELWGKSAEH